MVRWWCGENVDMCKDVCDFIVLELSDSVEEFREGVKRFREEFIVVEFKCECVEVVFCVVFDLM